MKRINFTFISGLLLAAISLFFSATGLVHLFAGAGIAIMVMAGAFEFAKIVLTVQILRHGWRRVLVYPQAIALLLLSGVSSLGVYGYLGRAYNLGHKSATVGAGSVAALEEQVKALEADRDRLYGQIEAIPAVQGSNRRRLTATLQPQILALDATIRAKRDSLTSVTTAQVGHETDVGELRYAAELLGVSQDAIAKTVITVLAFLLDPLAILLVSASGVKRQVTSLEELEREKPPEVRDHKYVPGTCTRPQENGRDDYFCTRDAGHEGPCPAVPYAWEPELARQRTFARADAQRARTDRVDALQEAANGLSPGLNAALGKHRRRGSKVVANERHHK